MEIPNLTLNDNILRKTFEAINTQRDGGKIKFIF